jgi:hypothetical protein
VVAVDADLLPADGHVGDGRGHRGRASEAALVDGSASSDQAGPGVPSMHRFCGVWER